MWTFFSETHVLIDVSKDEDGGVLSNIVLFLEQCPSAARARDSRSANPKVRKVELRSVWVRN